MDVSILKISFFLGLLAIDLHASTSPRMCPDNWIEHDPYCYYASTSQAEMREAAKSCNDSKATLLSINSQDENDWINNTLLTDSGTSYWTGLMRITITKEHISNETFAWADGSLPDNPEAFIQWAPNEPNKGTDELCGEITGQGTFNDNHCGNDIKFICKKAKGCFTPSGGENCSKCHCLDQTCDPHYGNCSKGCDAQHLGFNCSTVLKIRKPEIKSVTDDGAVVRWRVWTGTTINSALGPGKIIYQYTVKRVDGDEHESKTKDHPEKKKKLTMKKTFRGLSPATNYSLCVKVSHDQLENNCSEQELVHFTTLCPAPPPPVDVQVTVLARDSSTDLGFVKVKLAWKVTESPLDGCPQIVSYWLFSRETPTTNWAYHSQVNSSSNSSLHQGELTLRINGSYDFMVQAVDTNGNLSESNVTTANNIEPKECFLRYSDREKSGKNCTLCQCLNGVCNQYYGNCSEGCKDSVIGFNCSTKFRYPTKPIISQVSSTLVTIRWKRWTENINSDKGPVEIIYGIKIKHDGYVFKMENVTFPSTANDDLEHTVQGLESSSDYVASIDLLRDDGAVHGRSQSYAKFKTLCNAPPRPMDIDLKSEVGSSIVNLTIRYRAERTGLCDNITRYVVRYHKVNTQDQHKQRRKSGADIQQTLKLEANHTYAIMLEVFNKDNVSSVSPTYWINCQGGNQSSELKKISHSATTAKLNWLPRRTMLTKENYSVSCHAEGPSVGQKDRAVHPESEPEYPFTFLLKDLEPATTYKCNISDEPSNQLTFRTEAGIGKAMIKISRQQLTIIVAASASIALLLFFLLILVVMLCRKKTQNHDVPKFKECIQDIDLATFRQERASLAGSLASLDTVDEPIYANQDAIRPAPVSEHLMISELLEYIRKRVQERSFQAEFKSLGQFNGKHDHEVANKPENHLKNRFKNIYASDHSRVILSDVSPGGTDYINASYIKAHDNSLAYIASQGPVPASVSDMWEMIWQEKVATVVMLTGFWERNREKCSRYFEPEGTHLYGDISVRVQETSIKQGFEIKTMQVIKGDTRRHIHHFHFTAWPDHDAPNHPASILKLREAVNTTESEESLDGPIVVHCSAGVGRTGTYIAIDYLIKQAEATGKLNFVECAKRLRATRVKMIQSQNQYIYVHFTVLEHLLLGDTSIMTPDFSQTLERLVTKRQEMGATQLELQFEVLQLSIREDIIKSIEIIAEDHDHLRPTFIPRTKSKLTFIALQSPSEETSEEFLDLIRQYGVKVIVTLENKENGENYWNSDSLKMISVTDLEDCTIREFDFLERGMTRKVYQVYFKAWGGNNGLPAVPVLSLFIETIQSQIREAVQSQVNTETSQSQIGEQETAYIIVHCKNGTTRCGLFCAAYAIYKRIQKIPGEVNIYQAIRSIKSEQPAFIENVEQFIYLHELVKECLAKFSIYSNFQLST